MDYLATLVLDYLNPLIIVHTALSLIAILLGIFAVIRLFNPAVVTRAWTNWFLLTAFLTTLTGFPFYPVFGATPAFFTGIVALIILVLMVWAYGRVFEGRVYRWICAGGMVASLYLLVFVLIVQAFQKVGFLNQFAPNGNEPPFAVVQGIALVLFVVIGVAACRRYRPQMRR